MDREALMSGRVDYLLYYSAATANIMPITSACNVSCIFCSHKHNPPGIDIYHLPPLTLGKIRDLIGYLDATKKIVIGESVTKINEGEPFTHPAFFAILELLRGAFPRTPIQITTNGTLLTEQTVRRLAAFAPLELNLSLNSAGMDGRRRLMNDQSAQVAVQSPELLAACKIAFHGSVVGLPHLVGWPDIRDTCRQLERCGAQTIRLFLPGFPAFSPLAGFYPETALTEFAAEAKRLAAELTVPLTLEPQVPDDVQAIVEGVIASSPAARAGLQRGDIIVAVDGVAVRSRSDAFGQLAKRRKAAITVSRAGVIRRLELVRTAHQRPGVVMYYDIDFSLVDRIQKMAADRKVAAAAVLTSQLAYPLWRRVFADQSQIDVFPVVSRLFGGTIKAAGLLTVGDYQQTIDAVLTDGRYGLIMVPQISFDPAGRDLSGRSYLDLRAAGAEIATL
jgi:NifB/MoaA-like Fe-S oxidoreductase